MKINKIVLINPDHRLKSLPDLLGNDKYSELITTNTVIIADESKIRIISQNKEIDCDNSYFMIRSYDVDGVFDVNFISILYRYFYETKKKMDSPIYRYSNISSSKLTQVILFNVHGIPHPKTVICRESSYKTNTKTIAKEFPFPFVLKKDGANGYFVWKIENEDELTKKFKEYPNELFIIQKILTSNYDIRVLVFEGELIGAMKRESDSFLHNISQGAIGSKIEITEDEKNLSLKATHICENGLSGVDIIRDSVTNKSYVLELNRKPGFYGEKSFMDYTKINVPQKIVDILKKKYLSK